MEEIELARKKYRRDGFLSLLISSVGYLTPDRTLMKNKLRMVLFRTSVVNNDGVLFDIDTENLSPEKKRRMLQERYGPSRSDVHKLAKYITQTDADLLEIGAGIGYQTAIINQQLSERQKHVVLEANPSLIPDLERTKSLNDGDFIIENVAYTPALEEVELQIYDQFKETTLKSGRGQPVRTTTVPGQSLAELCEAHGLSEFVLYANMEGSEYELIKEELDVLREHCPYIIISYHAFTDDNHQDYLDLMANEFDVQWELGGGPGTYVYRNPRLEST